MTGAVLVPAAAAKPTRDPMYDAMVRGIDLLGGALAIPRPRLVVDGRPDLGAAPTR